MNAAELSKARLRKVDKPKEPPSLIKEVNSNTPADLSRLRVLNLEPRRFDPSTDSWVTTAAIDDSSVQVPTKLRVLTFNVWIQQDNLDQRMGALVSLIKKRKVDIVALQEATPKHLEQLRDQPFIREHFMMSGFEGQHSTYKTLILSRYPFNTLSSVDMPYSGRKVTMGTWSFRSRSHEEVQTFALSSVHLKSEANDWKARMEQFAFQDSTASQHHTSAIVGDFNFLFKREEEAFSSNGYTDVWRELHPKDPGITFDATNNHHALSTTCPGFGARLDRVALKSKVGWKARKIEIVGKQPIIPNALFISDHWGLLVTLKTHS